LLLALIAGAGSRLVSPPPHLERTFGVLTPQAASLAHDPAGGTDETGLPEIREMPSDAR
jgi:hypothetical protein